MSRRNKIIIAIVVLLLLLLLGALFLLRPPAGALPVAPEEGTGQNANGGGLGVNYSAGQFNVNVGTPPAPAPSTPPKKVDERNNLRSTAKSFAELFGSFSTEGNYQNIVDAEFYMTASLRSWAEGYVAEQRAKPSATSFAGTTTRAISVDITAYDLTAGTASVTVKTQRRETGSTTGADVVYYQDLKLEFLRVNDAWKVNVATWAPR